MTGRVIQTRRTANDEVNINFGEPGEGGAHRFPRIVVHQPQLPTCQQQSETLAVLIGRLDHISDSDGTKCDSRPGDRPDPLQPLRSGLSLFGELSAERLNRSENSSSLLSESTHGIGSTGST
jgi:hypothetical protein